MFTNSTPRVSYAIYSPDDTHRHENLDGMCTAETYMNHWASLVDTKRLITSYKGPKQLFIPHLQINGTYHHYSVSIHRKYTVIVEAWHNVAYEICPALGTNFVLATIDGGVTFRNPYGYLPAELYGFLPFEGSRMAAFIIFMFFFVFLWWTHRDTTLALHHGILAVVVFATVEATVWFVAYQELNVTGEPYCCPFPTKVVAALVLQVFRQTFSRSLLLVVCLGYGIVRPKLLPTEWVAIISVTVLYFITACIAAVAQITLVNDVHGSAPKTVFGYEMPSLLMDVIFLAWIYLALTSTIRILTEFQQTFKLTMYKQLAIVIGAFVVLYGVVAILILLDDYGIITWPWQWLWVQQVLWEVLNFAVLAAVCVICRPSSNSRMLSFVSQLPTSDPDEDDQDGAVGPDSMEEDGDDEENHGMKPAQPPAPASKASPLQKSAMVPLSVEGSKPKAKPATTSAMKPLSVTSSPTKDPKKADSEGFSSLPAADDEDDYGLNDDFDEHEL